MDNMTPQVGYLFFLFFIQKITNASEPEPAGNPEPLTNTIATILVGGRTARPTNAPLSSWPSSHPQQRRAAPVERRSDEWRIARRGAPDKLRSHNLAASLTLNHPPPQCAMAHGVAVAISRSARRGTPSKREWRSRGHRYSKNVSKPRSGDWGACASSAPVAAVRRSQCTQPFR